MFRLLNLSRCLDLTSSSHRLRPFCRTRLADFWPARFDDLPWSVVSFSMANAFPQLLRASGHQVQWLMLATAASLSVAGLRLEVNFQERGTAPVALDEGANRLSGLVRAATL
uniref:(northern house mosquito) hypothetical protein n=1 Tax=Culex pipiens TaxID=7175 RepID=A0A8D8FZT6_CULPI